MITLRQGEVNKIILDVTVNTYTGYFLINFIDPYTQDSKTALFQNLADSDCDYYVIHISETSPESLVDGRINLSTRGSWNLEIYAQESNTNLDVDNAIEFIKNEKLIVVE